MNENRIVNLLSLSIILGISITGVIALIQNLGNEIVVVYYGFPVFGFLILSLYIHVKTIRKWPKIKN